jgi:hypothetical protein
VRHQFEKLRDVSLESKIFYFCCLLLARDGGGVFCHFASGNASLRNETPGGEKAITAALQPQLITLSPKMLIASRNDAQAFTNVDL